MRKLNALENSMAALLKLPRYETIREDLERVIEGNRLIERINRILRNLERDKDRVGWQQWERDRRRIAAKTGRAELCHPAAQFLTEPDRQVLRHRRGGTRVNKGSRQRVRQ